jgi:chitinase
MTYDLHGTWDSTNPIGNIVQGHTNLTEIEQALELFWQVQHDHDPNHANLLKAS